MSAENPGSEAPQGFKMPSPESDTTKDGDFYQQATSNNKVRPDGQHARLEFAENAQSNLDTLQELSPEFAQLVAAIDQLGGDTQEATQLCNQWNEAQKERSGSYSEFSHRLSSGTVIGVRFYGSGTIQVGLLGEHKWAGEHNLTVSSYEDPSVLEDEPLALEDRPEIDEQ